VSDIGAITAEGSVLCANCHAPLTGPYCAACGQARVRGDRSVAHLLRNLIEDVISFDSRVLRTARALVLRPGELARAFREGRTQPYVPPVRLYLFVSLLFFLILSFTRLAPMQFAAEQGPSGVEPTIIFFSHLLPASAVAPLKTFGQELGEGPHRDGPAARQLSGLTQRFFADPAILNATMTEWIPRVLFLLLPLFALLLALFYWRQRKIFYFVDHLVFSLNFHSLGFVLLLAGALAAQFLPGVPALVVAALALYLLLAMHRVYGQGWKITAAKFVALGTIYVFFLLLPTFVGIILLAMFGVEVPHAA
jgi:hypothetical protein